MTIEILITSIRYYMFTTEISKNLTKTKMYEVSVLK